MAPGKTPKRAIRRVLSAARRLGSGSRTGTAERWSSYLAGTEPALAATPRVHRFAQVPILGEPYTPVRPLAVWIEGDGPAADVTRRSLEACTKSPTSVLGGSLSAALSSVRTDRLLLVRAGDVLAPLALERFGQAAALAPDALLITCDEDELDASGSRREPRFRPGPSPDRWLACDDSGLSLVVDREAALKQLHELADEPAWRHQIALLLAGAAAQHAAHVPLLLSHRGARSPEPAMLPPKTLQRVLDHFDAGAHVQSAAGIRRIRRSVGNREPLIEVIVCFRDRPELLRRCIESLLARTEYERLAVALVDNGSRDPQTLELLTSYLRDSRIRLLQDPRPFNFAALNNAAARNSSADVLVFLNNDTETVDSGWACALLEEALRPEIGAVAPMLVFGNGTVQHAGAALGLHGYAGHPFAGLRPSTLTPFGRADGGTRNWLAVTAACLMVNRAKFEGVGGFDESFIVAGNDVDLCLRLTAAGYRSLCVPHAVMVHDESRSRGAHIDPADFVRSERSYGEFRTVGDPFYNPNLTLDGTDCAVRVPGEGK